MGARTVIEFVLGYVVPVLVVPVVGGALVLAAFRITGNRDPKFKQCWWAYLAAFVYGFLMVAIVNFFVTWKSMPPWKMLALQAGVTWASHAIAVPLITRRRGTRDLLAQEGAILVANILFASFLFINIARHNP